MAGVKYERLADAVKACPSDASSTNEIRLLSDFECRDDDWAFSAGQKVAVDLNGHRSSNARLLIDCAEVVVRDTSAAKVGSVELLEPADLSCGVLTLESGKLVSGPGEQDHAAVVVGDDAGRFDFLGGEIVTRDGVAAVYVSNSCIRVGGNAASRNAGCNVVLDAGASLELVSPLTGRVGITTGHDVEGSVIGSNPSGFAGAENLQCDGDPMLRGRTTEDGSIVWERIGRLTRRVGRHVTLDLVDDLGLEILSNVDYAKGDKVTVKVEGLAKGLKLSQDKTTRAWIISGVPTEAVDFETRPMYARVTVTYKVSKQKDELLLPLALSIESPEPTVLPAGVLNQVYESVDISALWPEVAKEMKYPNEWTFKGWPAGVKYNNKATAANWSYKDAGGKSVKTTAAPYTVYGQPTKAGEYAITATYKHKIDGKTVSETFSAVLTVWGDDGKADFRAVDQAYVPTTAKPLTDVKSVGGLPAGIKFDKATGEFYGTPTKPGVFAVTATKPDNSKVTFLWKVKPGENSGILDEIGWDAEDSAVTVMQGVVQSWGVTMPAGAKVTVSGLPAGLKLAQNKKAWTLAGTPTKAGNYVVTFKTVRNGVTVTERVSVVVEPNKWPRTWYGVQKDGCETASLNAVVTVSANGTVKLVFSEGKDTKTVKTTVSAKHLDAGGETATLEVVKSKVVQRTFAVDFAHRTLKADGLTVMDLCYVAPETSAKAVTTFVLDEILSGETNAYAYVTATYNEKKGTFALSGKLWDGTKVKGTTCALDKATPSGGLCLAPVLLMDKAKNVVYLELSDDGSHVRVLENGAKLSIGNEGEPWSAGFAAAELKSKKFNMLSEATQLVVDAESSPCPLALVEKDRKASVSAQGLVKFTITDADDWKWACELLPVDNGGVLQFRGIATGTKNGQATRVCPVWAE